MIDDGSHRPEHIPAGPSTILFPMLPKGGVYAIEDIQTSYWPRYGGSHRPRRPHDDDGPDQVSGRRAQLRGVPHDEGYEPTYTERHVVAVHCYHNLVFLHHQGRQHRGLDGSSPLSDPPVRSTALTYAVASGGRPRT